MKNEKCRCKMGSVYVKREVYMISKSVYVMYKYEPERLKSMLNFPNSRTAKLCLLAVKNTKVSNLCFPVNDFALLVMIKSRPDDSEWGHTPVM